MNRPASRTAIAVVAKAPVPGRVKTRMQPALTPRQSADLASAMLADVTAAALATGVSVWWSYAGDAAVLERLRPPGVHLLAQVGDGLGQRLAHAHTTLHRRGNDKVVLVGADCPTVDAPALATATALLDDHDVVLGPAADGGYTLIGTRAVAPTLFTSVEMSTDHTARDTLDRAATLHLRVATTAVRPDLDRVEDLRRALRSGALANAPRTRQLVNSIRARLPRPEPHGDHDGDHSP